MTRQLWPLDPRTYQRHPLHRSNSAAWPETNCYVDVWIELLHTIGQEPLAALPFTFAVDLEGDQWTFFKFPLADLTALYGVEVFELNVWRPLLAHIEEQLALGRPAIVEVDAFHLPDTAGTAYQCEHIKTSIAVQALDQDGRSLGYFHNAGYHELNGSDFTGVFRLDASGTDATHLPPYVEVAKLPARSPRSRRSLAAASLDLLSSHLARRPDDNPFQRYATRFPDDLAWLADQPLAQFHRYAFATLRQCGAAFGLGAAYLRWLQTSGESGLDRIADTCDVIATTAKTLQFKTARVAAANRPLDPTPMLQTMAAAWDDVMSELTARYGALAPQG